MKLFLIVLASVLLYSCDSATNDRDTQSTKTYGNEQTPIHDDPYTVIETAFSGYPSKDKIQPMLEDIMKRYGMAITDDNILKAANVLVVMKNNSKVGVTEMEMLKYMYQHGNNTDDYATNVAIAATVLEQTK